MSLENSVPDLTILGGGIAGLTTGYYAGQHGVPFTVYEATSRLGGNCITFNCSDFRFDSGAHRVHDKDSQVTKDIQSLLGADLQDVAVPSQLFDGGRLVRFPFTFFDLVRHMGMSGTTRAARDFVAAHFSKRTTDSFASYAARRYGRTIADRFLLNYTEKLWGLPCTRLSPVLTGGRLRGLDVRQLVSDTIWKVRSRRNMEGNFLYPTEGIGMVPAALRERLGKEHIRTNARVTRIVHEDCRISGIEINGKQLVPVSTVVSTLPIDQVVALLDPPAPYSILHHSRQLTYRNIILVAFFLRRASVTTAATIYFPDHRFPFTRVVEPRNRSPHMSPPGHTSLVAELPCNPDDDVWFTADEELVRHVSEHLQRIGWIGPEAVLGTAVRHLDHAYPVIAVDAVHSTESIKDYLAQFRNLVLHGRNGTFQYKWIHNLFHEARLLVGALLPWPHL